MTKAPRTLFTNATRGPATMRRFFCASAFTLIFLGASATPSVADSVKTRAGAHDEYGRIVFDWTRQVGYDTEVRDGELIVRFAEPIETSLALPLSRLPGYVTGGEVSADGRTVRFSLTRDFRVKSFRSGGSKIVVDLLRDGADVSAPAPAKRVSAQSPAPRPAASSGSQQTVSSTMPGSGVTVHAGPFANKGRIVFEWPDKVDYRIERTGGTATIRFKDGQAIDANALSAAPGVWAASADSSNGETVVRMQVSGKAKLAHFRSGNRVVVDVSDPAANAARMNSLKLNTAELSPTARQMIATSRPTSASDSQSAQPRVAQSSSERIPTGTVALDEQNGTAPVRTRPSALQPLQVRRKDESKGVESLEGFDLGIVPTLTPTTRPRPGDALKPILVRGKDGASIVMPFPFPVAAAFFERAGYLWMAFNEKNVEVDFTNIQGSATEYLQDPEIVEKNLATIMRVSLVRDDLKITVERDRYTWIVRLAPEKGALLVDYPVEESEDAEGKPVFNVLAPGAATIKVKDPLRADLLYVTPVLEPRNGIAERRQFGDNFVLLPTAQGVVMKPSNPAVFARSFDDYVQIRMPTAGGKSDAEMARDTTIEDIQEAPQIPVLFPLEEWRRGEFYEFLDVRDRLMNALAAANTRTQRNAARRQLAEFYFAHGLGEETLSLIQNIVAGPDADTNFERDRVFRAMRGVAHILADEWELSVPDLSSTDLDGEKEAEMWRGALAEHQNMPKEAAELMKGTNSLIPNRYAPHVRDMLNLAGARAGVDSDDTALGRLFLDQLDSQASPGAFAESQLIQADIIRGIGDQQDVEGLVSSAARTTDRRINAVATMELLSIRLAKKAIDPADATEELEQLRLKWRGDHLEFDALRMLGQLYVKDDMIHRGLGAMRQAVRHFPDHPATPEIRNEMRDVFADIYLHDKVNLPILTSVALFDEFRDLVPVTEEGDVMIQNLAHRLRCVDLLSESATLLEYQIDNRLDGVRKAEVGRDAAVLRILNREPSKALEALKSSRVDEIAKASGNLSEVEMEKEAQYVDVRCDERFGSEPRDQSDIALRDERARLRAKALFELDQPGDALDLIADDESDSADRLRADIAWATGDWDSAAEAYARLLGDGPPQDNRLIKPQESQLIINLAVSLLLSDQVQALGDLRARFARQMAEGPHSGDFRLITAGTGSVGDIKSIAQELGEVQAFESFMASYRQRVETEALQRQQDAIN